METITVKSAGFSPHGTNAVSDTDTRSPVLKQQEDVGPVPTLQKYSLKQQETSIEADKKPVKLTSKIGEVATA